MKTRAGRVILWSFFALVAVIASALVVCLDRVDYRPYFREPYYAETSARLRAQVATNLIWNGELSAGFGKAIGRPIGEGQSRLQLHHGEAKQRPFGCIGKFRGPRDCAVRIGDGV